MRVPGWLFIIGILLLVGLTIFGAIVSYNVARQVAIDAGSAGVQVAAFADFLQAQPTATNTSLPPSPTPTPQPGATAAPTIAPTQDPAAPFAWEDPRRISILLMGIDQRSGVEEAGPFRTDTMMLVSIDPVRKTAGVLSIPRDLWVTIPGFQPGRINTANSLGDTSAYPGGGPALAAATVQENLGIRVEKYILVNFDVFTQIVNTIAPAGVEVCPTEVIDDPDYPDAGYGTIAVYFELGCQRLEAERLLQYARTRATYGGDFDRARRQQEVLRAIQNEVLSAGGIVNFIGQIPTLWDQLTGNFRTNLSLDEITRLAFLAQDISRDDIQFGVIDNLYVNLVTTNLGDQVLVPKGDSIRFLVQQVFNAQQELTLADLRTRADAEAASIVVYNNTDIAGLAAQTRDWLASRQVTVDAIGNPEQITNTPTLIRDYTGNPWTARYLAALMGLPADRVQPGGDGATAHDVMIVVGTDIQPILTGAASAP